MSLLNRLDQSPQARARDRVSFHRLAGAPDREWFQYRASTAGPGAPLLVIVHGIARNAVEYVFRLREAAEAAGAIVVSPHFSRADYGRYQQVVAPGGVRADVALDAILAEVSRTTGCRADRFHLTGVSGGAQFAHRYALLHPDRVASLSLMAAGWYTLPDPSHAWPLGTGGAPGAVDPGRLAATRITVFVGDRDRARDPSLRVDPEIDSLQGRHRLARARRWTRAMRAAGCTSLSLVTLPGVSHALQPAFDGQDLARRLFEHAGLQPAGQTLHD